MLSGKSEAGLRARRRSDRGRYLLGAMALFVVPPALMAQTADLQEQEQVEEVIVTGSFIRNSQFTESSPIITITQDDIWQ